MVLVRSVRTTRAEATWTPLPWLAAPRGADNAAVIAAAARAAPSPPATATSPVRRQGTGRPRPPRAPSAIAAQARQGRGADLGVDLATAGGTRPLEVRGPPPHR